MAHRDELIPLLAALFKERTTAAWETLLKIAEVPHARSAAVDEVVASPQTAAREMVWNVVDDSGRPLKLIGSPIHWPERPPPAPLVPPRLGEHTRAVLHDWLRYDAHRIEQLRREGVVAE